MHKDSIFACILDAQGKKIFEQRYGTLTPELTQLRDTMVEHGCGMAAMESTSIYWILVWWGGINELYYEKNILILQFFYFQTQLLIYL